MENREPPETIHGPILNEHCVECHNYKKREGRVALTDDLGVTWSLSYYMLLAKRQVADGRNGYGNQKPRTIGTQLQDVILSRTYHVAA